MQLPVISINGVAVGKFVLPSDFVLFKKIHNQPLFDAVLLEQASKRQATHSTKTKGEVSGTGKKPYAQKKTGNARQGSRRNPQFVGGGVAFGPKPNRNYGKKMNRKVHALAFHSALSALFHNDKLFVLADDLLFEQKPCVKDFIQLLVTQNLVHQKLLLVVNDHNRALVLSARNVKEVVVKLVSQISVLDLVAYNRVLIQQSALTQLLKRKGG